ncbi:hypothetical protein ACXR2U_01600 [Jatrophihabitans sp. YIM 134969]
MRLARSPATLRFADWIELAVLLTGESRVTRELRCAVATRFAARRAFHLAMTHGYRVQVDFRPGSGRHRLALYDVCIDAAYGDGFLRRVEAAHRMVTVGRGWLAGASDDVAHEWAKALWRSQLLANGPGVTRDGHTVALRTFTAARVEALVAAGARLGLTVQQPRADRKELRNRLLVHRDELGVLRA